MNQVIKDIEQLETEVMEKKEAIRKLRKQLKGEPVENYTFFTTEGEEITLLELFGDKTELFVIHNMGRHCSFCTMWADGFSGVYSRIIEKASFVVSSPDEPSDQKSFIEERGWTFPMVSTANAGNTFKKDFEKICTDGGLSVFSKQEDGTILHHTKSYFEPGDEFGVIWNLLDLLPSQ